MVWLPEEFTRIPALTFLIYRETQLKVGVGQYIRQGGEVRHGRCVCAVQRVLEFPEPSGFPLFKDGFPALPQPAIRLAHG